MGSLVKAAYCQYNNKNKNNILPCFQHHYYHYRGPSNNLHNPISLFAITSPSISPTDHSSSSSSSPTSSSSSSGYKQQQQSQFGGRLIIPAVAVAASAWFFLRPPIITTAPPIDIDLELEEEGGIKEIPLQRKPGHVKALHFYKTKPGTVFKVIEVYSSSSDGNNYESLKARIRLSAEWLETARKELEERDPGGRVLEYSQVVDELMDLLRDMDVYVDQCEKDKVKGYLRSCNRLLARVRKMEARILHALKEFHHHDDDDDDDEPRGGGGHN